MDDLLGAALLDVWDDRSDAMWVWGSGEDC